MKKQNYNGNINRYTNNIGHDTAKNRLSNKLKNNNFDIYTLRELIFANPQIKFLINKKAIKVSKITGQNFVIGCKNELLANYRHVNYVNKDVYIVQVVNNICNNILKNYGFTGYGKTQAWKSLNPDKYTYSDRIYFGSDILSYNWLQENYSQKLFTCKLSDRQKIKKYQKNMPL